MAVGTGVSTGIGGSVESGCSGAWVGDDVAVDCGASVGATVAAEGIGGWGGCVAVRVAAPVDAQPAIARQATMMAIRVIFCVFMLRFSQSEQVNRDDIGCIETYG